MYTFTRCNARLKQREVSMDDVTHVWMGHLTHTHMHIDESRLIHECGTSHTHECDFSHTSYFTHRNAFTHKNESRHMFVCGT